MKFKYLLILLSISSIGYIKSNDVMQDKEFDINSHNFENQPVTAQSEPNELDFESFDFDDESNVTVEDKSLSSLIMEISKKVDEDLDLNNSENPVVQELVNLVKEILPSKFIEEIQKTAKKSLQEKLSSVLDEETIEKMSEELAENMTNKFIIKWIKYTQNLKKLSKRLQSNPNASLEILEKNNFYCEFALDQLNQKKETLEAELSELQKKYQSWTDTLTLRSGWLKKAKKEELEQINNLKVQIKLINKGVQQIKKAKFINSASLWAATSKSPLAWLVRKQVGFES